jgi:hypothetical protein
MLPLEPPSGRRVARRSLQSHPARHEGLGGLGRLATDAAERVAVDVPGHADRGVPEPLGDDGDVHSTGQHQARGAVPEVVKPGPAQPR